MQVQADGMLKVSGEEPAFLYPTDATKVDFILYAPWNPSLEENVLQLDVRNQAKSDFAIIFTAIMLKTSIVQPHR